MTASNQADEDAAALALLPLEATYSGAGGSGSSPVDEANAIAFHQLVTAARRVQLPGFDTQGSFKAGVYTVDYRRLWPNPASPRTYPRESVREMANSLASERQKTPLIVAQFRDPRPPAEGGTGGDLLIIDGVRRYMAAPLLAWPLEELDVIIHPLPTLYDVMLETAIIQVSPGANPLSEREAGILCRRLIAIHRMLRERGVPGLPDLRQEDLGRIVGRDRTTVSRMLALSELPDDVQLRLDTSEITETQARELLSLAPRDATAVSERLARENAERGAPLTQREARVRVTERKLETGRGPDPTTLFSHDPDGEYTPRPADLWCDNLEGVQVPVAIGMAAHDLSRLIAAAIAVQPKGKKVDPAIRNLQRALDHPTIAAFVAQFADVRVRDTTRRHP